MTGPEAHGTPAAASSGSPRVLVIEDDAILGRAITAMLRPGGFNCDHVQTAAAARARFAAQPYAVLVCDVNLPDDDGIALATALQAIRHVPVVVITGSPTLDAALAAIRMPVVAFVVKPFLPATLLEAVQRAASIAGVMAEISLNLNRIDRWRGELLAFEAMLKSDAATSSAALLALTARQLMEGMADLRVQIAALTAAPAAGAEANSAALAALNGSRPLLLLEAIRDTITVLDRTRDAFRSRELGELRKRLEALLGGKP